VPLKPSIRQSSLQPQPYTASFATICPRVTATTFEHGCPVSGFAGDAPRVGTKAQTYFVHGLDDQITIIAALIP
jgi:hypothetical protein